MGASRCFLVWTGTPSDGLSGVNFMNGPSTIDAEGVLQMPHTGSIPYGYRVQDGVFLEHEGEQEVLDLVRDHARQGLTLAQSARALNVDGYRNRWGNVFSRSAVQRILRDHCDDLERLHVVMVLDRLDAEALRNRAMVAGQTLNLHVQGIVAGSLAAHPDPA